MVGIFFRVENIVLQKQVDKFVVSIAGKVLFLFLGPGGGGEGYSFLKLYCGVWILSCLTLLDLLKPYIMR